MSNFWEAVGAPKDEKALTVVIEDGACDSVALDGCKDWGSSLVSVLPSVFVERGEELGGFGAAKKELRVACSLGFLADEASASAALRFTGVAMFKAGVARDERVEQKIFGVTRRFIRI